MEDLLKATGVKLRHAGVFEELRQFQNYLSDYKIIVYYGLSPERVMFSGDSIPSKKLHLIYDSNLGHYNVITNLRLQ